MQNDIQLLFHNLTKELLTLGVSQKQLAAVRFLRPDPSVIFDNWAFTYPPEIPTKSISHLKDYLALRWVLQDEGNRVVSGAYQHAQTLLLAESYSSDMAFKKRQARKAKKPRRLTDDNQSPLDLVLNFCTKPENSNRSANEMWPHFFGFLEDQRLDPTEISQTALEFRSRNCNVKLTIRTFANLVSKARKRINNVKNG